MRSNIHFAWISIVRVLLLLQLQAPASAASTAERRVITASTTMTLKLNCTGDGPRWLVDGDFKTTGDLRTLGISEVREVIGQRTAVSKLQFNVTVISNGTEIECRVRAGSEITTAVSVTFIIQGPLDPPGNFHIIPIHSSLLQLWWSEPFSLDLTDHDPDISGYSINIANLNTGLKMQVNTTERPYHFSGIPEDGEKPYPCNLYEFSIRARNVGSLGNSSREVIASFPEIPYQVHAKPKVLFSRGKPARIELTLQVNATCHGRIPDYIDVTFPTEADNNANSIAVIRNETETGVIIIPFTQTIENVSVVNYCIVQLTARNVAGSSPPTIVPFECKPIGNTTVNTFEDRPDCTGAIVGATLGGILIGIAATAGLVLVIMKVRVVWCSRGLARPQQTSDGTTFDESDTRSPATRSLSQQFENTDVGPSTLEGIPLKQNPSYCTVMTHT